MGRKKGITKELIAWRRNQVAAMLAKGIGIDTIAEKLQLSSRLVYEDAKYIRTHSSRLLAKYLADTLPVELGKCLLRLNEVSNQSWAMVDDQKLHAREKIAALARAESSAINIIELLTNNKELVYTALGRRPKSLIEFKQSVLSSAVSEQEPEPAAEDEYNQEDSQEQDERLDHEFSNSNTKRDQPRQDPNRVF
jgi:hypothetical protein